MRLWDLHTQKTTAVLKGHIGRVTAVALTKDAATVVSGSADKSVRVWRVAGDGNVATLHVLQGNLDKVWLLRVPLHDAEG